MRTLIHVVAVVALSVLPMNLAQAALISLDFNVQNANSPFQESPTASGEEVAGVGTIFTGQTGPWNTLLVGTAPFELPDATAVSTTAPLATGNLIAGNGAQTLTTFTYAVGASVGSPVNYRIFQGTGTGSTALRQDMVLTGAAQPGPIAWEIAGLIPGNSYDLVLFGQQYNNTNFNPGTWTIFGNPSPTVDGQNDANFSNIIANAQGKITGTHLFLSGNYSSWSGLQIQGTFAEPLAPAPEPSSMVLLAGGLLGMMARRRKAMAK